VTGQQCRWTAPKLPVTCRPTTPAPTKTVTEADALKNYLVNSGLASIRELSWSQNDPPDAKLGDIIGYDWNGGADGVIDHVMMITNFSGGYPLVSGHTEPEIDGGWPWRNKFSGWIDQIPNTATEVTDPAHTDYTSTHNRIESRFS